MMSREELPANISQGTENRKQEALEKSNDDVALEAIKNGGFLGSRNIPYVWDLAKKKKDGVLELRRLLGAYSNALKEFRTEKTKPKTLGDLSEAGYSINPLAADVAALVKKWEGK